MIDVVRDVPLSWECPDCGAPVYRGHEWMRAKAQCAPDCPTREGTYYDQQQEQTHYGRDWENPL